MTSCNPIPLSLAATAVLLFGAGQIQAAKGGPEDIANLKVAGVQDAATTKIILVNASRDITTNRCTNSIVLTYDSDPGLWQDITPPPPRSLRPLKNLRARRALRQKDYLVRIRGKVEHGCWCNNPLAGIAVHAPGLAVAYRSAHPRYARQAVNTVNLLCPDRSFLDEGETLPEITIRMRDKRDVPVMVWVPDQGNFESMARDEIANADWIYETALAGITLHPVFTKTPVTAPPEAPKDPVMPSCSSDNRDDCCLAVTRSPFFDPGAINIYYGNGSRNFSCNGVPAVFIHDRPILGDVAHELGHQLGLNQSDHSPEQLAKTPPANFFEQGHTTFAKQFSCDNVMFEDTHFLKNSLSLAQAFWISQNGGSFVNQNSATFACADNTAKESACPLFVVGAKEPQQCLTTPAVMIPQCLDGNPFATRDLPASTYRTGREIEQALDERYKLLKAHAKGKGDLRLGAIGRGDFKDHWAPLIAINLTHPKPATEREQKELLRSLVPGRIRRRSGLESIVKSIVQAKWAGQSPSIPTCSAKPLPSAQ